MVLRVVLGINFIFIICMAFFYESFAIVKKEVTDLKNFQNYLENLSFEDHIKLKIFGFLEIGEEKLAKTEFEFYKVLKTTYAPIDKVLENVVYIPKGKFAIVVSKRKQQIKVYTNENSVIKQIVQNKCITGKRPGDKLQEGDQRTPNGIYFPLTFIDKSRLAEIYGEGAYPLNYPNIIDKKLLKRNGHGIWLHATNDNNRPPFSSNGCVVVTNDVFKVYKDFVNFKETPIIIVEDFSYTTLENQEKTKNSIIEFLYNWKEAWEKATKNGNIDRYLSFYSKNMISQYGGFENFKRHKINVSKYKKWIRIYIKDINISKDGRILDFGNLYTVSFFMEYNSNNYNWKGRKILYLINENGKWKILAEESL
ncbi:MAG: hypothetical protein DSY47_00710 [Hydrogenothermus sp.]|nr:MAG: hypothetical protein DSY47_00710 [Hydrogenothermus sp.]